MIDGPDLADLPYLDIPSAPTLVCSASTEFSQELSTLARNSGQATIACTDLSRFTATLAEQHPACVLLEGPDEFINRALRLFELMDNCEAALFVCTPHDSISLDLSKRLTRPVVVLSTPSNLMDLVSLVQSATAIHGLRQLARTHLKRYAKAVDRLSDAQRDVLHDICAGKPNKSIASRQQVSLRTVEQRRRRVFDVLGVPSAGPLGYEVGFISALRLLDKATTSEHPC